MKDSTLFNDRLLWSQKPVFIWYAWGALTIPFPGFSKYPCAFHPCQRTSGNERRAWEKQENASWVKKRLPTLSSTVTLPPLSYLRQSINGQVSEWSNEHAWKVCVLETVPRVRIPPCPPSIFHRNIFVMSILRFLFIGAWGRNGENIVDLKLGSPEQYCCNGSIILRVLYAVLHAKTRFLSIEYLWVRHYSSY